MNSLYHCYRYIIIIVTIVRISSSAQFCVDSLQAFGREVIVVGMEMKTKFIINGVDVEDGNDDVDDDVDDHQVVEDQEREG